MQTKFLDFYKQCMETGEMPDNGLCACFPDNEIMALVKPSAEEKYQLWEEGLTYAYWGSGLSVFNDQHSREYGFTPLRQTIVLLCAAIDGEY